jgi:alanine racemase
LRRARHPPILRRRIEPTARPLPGRPAVAVTGPRPPIETRLAAAGLPALPRTAWLEIDLDALRHNLDVLRRLAGPGVPILPVVKADAYGHGAVEVAQALEGAGVAGLCVATYDEAVQLRAAGILVRILVLYPIPTAWLADAASQGIAVAAGDALLLDALVEAAHAMPAAALEVELEVETGLGRGGFAGDDLVAAARRISEASGLRLSGLWTHLQAVEDPALTDDQIARFEAATASLSDAGVPLPGRHVAASAAVMDGGVASYDGIRPGLSVYGLVPDELAAVDVPAEVLDAFRPVMALYARPVRVRDLPEGWGISYGPTFRTTRPSRIATLPLGYGDGWSRLLSNRAAAIVRGIRVPLVGNVAMDAIMADVTDVPGAPVTVADEFVLLGRSGDERITVADLALVRTTNSWEVVTGMARRLPRVYHAAAGPVGLRTLTERRT